MLWYYIDIMSHFWGLRMDVTFRGRYGVVEQPEDCIPCRTAFEHEGTVWRALAL